MKNRLRSSASIRQIVLLGFLCLTAIAWGNTEYYRHVLFDNSLTSDSYFYSQGTANGASTLELVGWRLPVETKTFLTPPNALRLRWQSQRGGGWEAEVRIDGYRNRLPELKGRNLYFWCFAPQAIAAADLPMLVLSNTSEGLQVAQFPGAFTAPLALGKIAGDIPAGKWIQVRIPLSELRTASIYEFRLESLQNIIFHQGRGDGARHTLIIDEIRVGDDAPASSVSIRIACTTVTHPLILRTTATSRSSIAPIASPIPNTSKDTGPMPGA